MRMSWSEMGLAGLALFIVYRVVMSVVALFRPAGPSAVELVAGGLRELAASVDKLGTGIRELVRETAATGQRLARIEAQLGLPARPLRATAQHVDRPIEPGESGAEPAIVGGVGGG